MSESTVKASSRSVFEENLPSHLKLSQNSIERLILREYGSIFVAAGGAVLPKTIVFKDEMEVSRFQSSVKISPAKIGGFTLELQAPAMKALLDAISHAESQSLTITPRGADSARRRYAETVSLWASRVEPALEHWTEKGKISQDDATRITDLSPFKQVSEVLKLEEKRIFFSKDLSKSIIYSVAPPGTSQHLAMLALDIKEHDDPKVRYVLAKHLWYQTVISDLPHFTFLGVKQSKLSGLGLKKIKNDDREFWVPKINRNSRQS